jgi:hypothetical protein
VEAIKLMAECVHLRNQVLGTEHSMARFVSVCGSAHCRDLEVLTEQCVGYEEAEKETMGR